MDSRKLKSVPILCTIIYHVTIQKPRLLREIHDKPMSVNNDFLHGFWFAGGRATELYSKGLRSDEKGTKEIYLQNAFIFDMFG